MVKNSDFFKKIRKDKKVLLSLPEKYQRNILNRRPLTENETPREIVEKSYVTGKARPIFPQKYL